jgi:hypothetical protein
MKKQKQTRKMDKDEKQETIESEPTRAISPVFPEASNEKTILTPSKEPERETPPTQIKITKTTRQLFPNDKQGYIKLAVIPIASAVVAKLLANDMVDRMLAKFIKNSIVLEGVKMLILVVFIALLLIVFKCL